MTYLLEEFFVNDRIILRTNSLLQEREQDGNNNASLKAFSEADEED